MSETTNTSNSTGPRTEKGKAISSQNARKNGLFAVRDFVRPEEQQEYEELRDSLESELSPEGALERHTAAEILGAMWRLRRCAQLESGIDPAQHDPMDPESPSAKLQLSIDRARNQATRLLHKNTAELRRLQTERQFRDEIAADGMNTEGISVLCDFHTAAVRADRAVKAARDYQYNQMKTQLDAMELEGRRNALNHLTKRTPPAPGENKRETFKQAA